MWVVLGPVESEIGESAIRDEKLPKMKEGNKMPTARCTQLIAKGQILFHFYFLLFKLFLFFLLPLYLQGIYYNFGEIWVAQQPFLLFTYVLVISYR